jgi:hypothetical protein
VALAASSKGGSGQQHEHALLLGALLTQHLGQGFPVAGEVHGAGQDHLRVQLFQLVEHLDRVAEVDDLEAQGLEVIGQEVLQGVVAGDDQRLHSVPRLTVSYPVISQMRSRRVRE